MLLKRPKKPPLCVESLLTKAGTSSPSSSVAAKVSADLTETATLVSSPSSKNDAACRAIPKALPNSPNNIKGFRAPAVKTRIPSAPAYSIDHSASKRNVTGVHSENSVVAKTHTVDASEKSAAKPDPLQEATTQKDSTEQFITVVLQMLQTKPIEEIYEAYIAPHHTSDNISPVESNEEPKSEFTSDTCPTSPNPAFQESVIQEPLDPSVKRSVAQKLLSEDDFEHLVRCALLDTQELSTQEMFRRYFTQAVPDVGINTVSPQLTESDAKPVRLKRSPSMRARSPCLTEIYVSATSENGEGSHDSSCGALSSCKTPCDPADSNEPEETAKVSPAPEGGINHMPPADLPGTWVECTQCGKWRLLEHVVDPSEVPEIWHCGLQPKYDNHVPNEYNPCDEAQADLDDDELAQEKYVFTKFTAGSIVWVKLNGYPEWPAMVDCDETGRYADYNSATGEVLRYFVVFFDPKDTTHQRVRQSRVRKFTSSSEVDWARISPRYRKRIEWAAEEAERALKLPLHERIFKFGYPHAQTWDQDTAINVKTERKRRFTNNPSSTVNKRRKKRSPTSTVVSIESDSDANLLSEAMQDKNRSYLKPEVSMEPVNNKQVVAVLSEHCDDNAGAQTLRITPEPHATVVPNLTDKVNSMADTLDCLPIEE